MKNPRTIAKIVYVIDAIALFDFLFISQSISGITVLVLVALTVWATKRKRKAEEAESAGSRERSAPAPEREDPEPEPARQCDDPEREEPEPDPEREEPESPSAWRRAVLRARTGPALVTHKALEIEDALAVPDCVVLDVETTGLNPETDEIIEVAAIRSIGGILEAYDTFVRPKRHIPSEITKLTGIRNSDVIRAPRIAEVAPKLLGFIGDLPVVAHNAAFDVKFIAAAFEKIGADIHIRYIDTVRLARLAFPGMANYKLATLIRELELLDVEQQHRALSDAEATLRLFELCREEISARREKEERMRQEMDLLNKAANLNQYGAQAEASGNIDRAIAYYEDIVSDKAPLPNAYVRLAILYKKRKQWADVVRVCDAALAVLPGHSGKLCQPEEWEKRKAYAVSKLDTNQD